VGSVAAFIGAIAGVLLVTFDLPVFLAIIICLLLGALIGAWQGFWTAYLKIPAFIVTLAGMLIFRGLTLVVLGGRTLAPFLDGFRELCSSYVPDDFVGGVLQLLIIFIGILASLFFVKYELKFCQTYYKDDLHTVSLALFILNLVAFIAIIN